MFKAAKIASAHGAHRFGIVTSGTKVEPGRDLDEICRAIRMIRAELPILPCASLGIMTEDAMLQLKEAGLDRYHHNLEASPSYFPEVCTTRPYSSQTDTVKTAKRLGFSVCSGGIFGIGESKEQRIELLETIRSLDVDSVPMNFLSPIPGTLLENGCGITALDCLRTIAAARLMMPDKSIRVCGGCWCRRWRGGNRRPYCRGWRKTGISWRIVLLRSYVRPAYRTPAVLRCLGGLGRCSAVRGSSSASTGGTWRCSCRCRRGRPDRPG